MRLFAFGLSAVVAIALSAGTASAQHAGHSHRPAVVSPGYGGGYLPAAPRYTPGFASPGVGLGGSFYTPLPRGHYDYVPGHFDRHRGHFHYTPGHYDYHVPFTPRPRH